MDELDAVEILNKYFISLFTWQELESITDPKQALVDSRRELIRILFTKKNSWQFENSQESRHRRITSRFLHEVSEEIGEVIAQILIDSMQTGDVPLLWRDALIRPLFKWGNRSEPCNCKPVSLISFVCRPTVMEIILKDHNYSGARGRE